MAVMERLALIIDADGKGAVRELDRVGRAADRELGRAEDKTQKWSQTFTSVGTKMIAASAVIGAGLWNAAQATSDLNEAVNQTDQVFGSAASKVGEFAENATAIGQSERAAREAANTFGLFFEKANVSNDEAADMSITMTQLASDMASFKNTSPQDAVDALGAALRGESEPIRRYGVLLDDATLKQRAFDMGLTESTTGTLPPAIKMQAAYAEILEQTGTIQGDFVRTADGAANAQRIAAAEFENAKASIGEGFLPVMQQVVGIGGDVANTFAGLNDATGGFVSKMLAIGTVVGAAGGGIAIAAGQAMQLASNLKAAAAAGGAWSKAMVAAAGPVAASLAGLVAIWGAMEYEMTQGRNAASDMGTQIENAVLKASPEKLNRMLAETNTAINSIKSDIEGSNDLAFWDAGWRASMSAGGAELEKQGELIATLILQTDKLSEATGNSKDNILGWLQAQASQGIVYENSAGALDAYRLAVEQSGGAVDTATAAQLDFAEEIEDTEGALQDAIDAIDEFYGKLDAPGDLISNWEASMDGLQSALQENGTAWNYVTGELDLGTEAGRANRDAMKDVRDAAVDMGQAVLDGGGSADEAATATLGYVANLREMLRQSGYSEAAIETLIADLGLTPETVTTTFSQPGMDVARDNLAKLQAQLDALPRFKAVGIQVKSGLLNMLGIDGPRAAGGPVAAGGTYLVGERGPELVTMGAGGTVHNARETERMTGGGTTVVQLVVDGKVFTEQVIEPNLAKSRRAHTGSRRIG